MRERSRRTFSTSCYCSLCETVAETRPCIERNALLELRHETFVENPTTGLQDLCRFLGVGASGDYFVDCANTVFPAARHSRSLVHWDTMTIDLVKEGIARFPFLHGYAYDAAQTDAPAAPDCLR